MKKFFYATMVALAGLAFAACNPTDANEQGGGSSTKAPVLGTIEGAVLDIAGNDIVITFTEADFGQKVSIDYALYVDKVGNKMADKSLVKTLVCMLFSVRLVLPLLFNIFSQGRFFSENWLSINIYTLISQLAFTVGIFYAGTNNLNWIEFVWDQPAFVETDDMASDAQDEQ